MEENNDFTPQVFDNPQDLAAAMTAEANTESAPEAAAEPAAEPTQETAPVDSSPVDTTPSVDSEQSQDQPEYDAVVEDVQPQQQDQPGYTPEGLDERVLSYMRQRVGREDVSWENLQAPEISESVDVINRFVQETGRTPSDWFKYQSLDPENMDDLTAVKVAAAAGYQSLTPQEIDMLVSGNYKLDAEKHGEETARLAALRLKIDAQQARAEVQEIRNRYAAPVDNDYNDEPVFDQQWINNMAREFDAVDGLEFDLGDGQQFTFGLNDQYRRSMMERGARLDEFFDPFFGEDGSFDYDGLATQMAVLDNIDTIVRAAYNKGRGDGQRGLVDKAANVGTVQPNSGNMNESNPLGEQVKNIMSRQSNTLTFNI